MSVNDTPTMEMLDVWWAAATHLGVLAAQRIDAQDLAADAEQRGWIDEADRHRKLIARLDTLIAQSEPA
jgi:hypothetical protein